MKVCRMLLKHVSWEYITTNTLKEYADYLQLSDDEAKQHWQKFKEIGKTPAFENLTIIGGYARGFGQVDQLLRELMNDLQAILARRWVLGFRSVGRCPECGLHFMLDV